MCLHETVGGEQYRRTTNAGGDGQSRWEEERLGQARWAWAVVAGMGTGRREWRAAGMVGFLAIFWLRADVLTATAATKTVC